MEPPQSSILPLAQLRKFVAQFTVTPEAHAALFAGTGITQEQVAEPDFELTPAIMWDVCANVRRAFGPAWYLGVPALWGTDLHSELDFAMRTAPTLAAALDISVKYGSIRWPIVASTLDVGKNVARFSVTRTEHVPLPEWQMLGVIAGLNTQWLLEHAYPSVLDHCRAEFQGPPPLPEPEMAKFFKTQVRWNAPSHAMIFPSRLLDTPSVLADSRSCAAFVEILRKDFVIASPSVATRVTNVLGDVTTGRMRGNEVARRLGVSYRTLARQLSGEGTSFELLRDANLKARAELLFRTTQLSVAEVAEQLGYGDLTAFNRAAKRWSKSSASEFRRRLREKDSRSS